VDIPHRQFSTSCAAVAALLLAVAAEAQDTTARSDSTSRKPAIPLPGVAITATAVDTTRPVLDTISAATGGSVGALELQALPSDERDPTEVAITVPGAARGVGFFDFLHSQTGVAPNVIELHPVLDIQFGTGGTPTPIPTSTITPTPTSTVTPTPTSTGTPTPSPTAIPIPSPSGTPTSINLIQIAAWRG